MLHSYYAHLLSPPGHPLDARSPLFLPAPVLAVLSSHRLSRPSCCSCDTANYSSPAFYFPSLMWVLPSKRINFFLVLPPFRPFVEFLPPSALSLPFGVICDGHSIDQLFSSLLLLLLMIQTDDRSQSNSIDYTSLTSFICSDCFHCSDYLLSTSKKHTTECFHQRSLQQHNEQTTITSRHNTI
jgi:hypothetical protein